MEQAELDILLPEFEKLYRKILSTKLNADNIDKYLKQYDPEKHDVVDAGVRKDKPTNTDAGVSYIPVARIPLPMQKRIVMMAAAVLCGNPIELECLASEGVEKNLLEVIKATWEDNKLDYLSKKLAKIMMSQTEAAEIWYVEDAEEGYWDGTPNEGGTVRKRLRIKTISNEDGDKMYPVFTSAGDMIAFGRGYFIREGEKDIEHFDVYLANKTIKAIKEASVWITTEEPNLIGKIPVIYYSQSAPEWSDVQRVIERWETSFSNHADANDYFGSPTWFVVGKIVSFAKKGDQGKVLQAEPGSTVQPLVWASAPESIKLEQQNLRSAAFDFTETPDITKDNENLTGVQSGIALKMRFLPAHLKAADKEETFGIGIQRRINFIKAAMMVINLKLKPAQRLKIKPKFEYYLPKDFKEMIDMLATATNSGKLMSQETAVSLNPLVSDPEAEMTRIEEEANAAVGAIVPPGPGDKLPPNGTPTKTKPTNGKPIPSPK